MADSRYRKMRNRIHFHSHRRSFVRNEVLHNTCISAQFHSDLNVRFWIPSHVDNKRIPSIFNDESTGSFICLAYSAFLCFLTSSGSMVPYTITPQSGIDHDFVSVVNILLKASPHSFLQHTYCYVTCSKVNARSSQTSSDVTIWRCGAQRHTIMKYPLDI
jgi:hypothetical protein